MIFEHKRLAQSQISSSGLALYFSWFKQLSFEKIYAVQAGYYMHVAYAQNKQKRTKYRALRYTIFYRSGLRLRTNGIYEVASCAQIPPQPVVYDTTNAVILFFFRKFLWWIETKALDKSEKEALENFWIQKSCNRGHNS